MTALEREKARRLVGEMVRKHGGQWLREGRLREAALLKLVGGADGRHPSGSPRRGWGTQGPEPGAAPGPDR